MNTANIITTVNTSGKLSNTKTNSNLRPKSNWKSTNSKPSFSLAEANTNSLIEPISCKAPTVLVKEYTDGVFKQLSEIYKDAIVFDNDWTYVGYTESPEWQSMMTTYQNLKTMLDYKKRKEIGDCPFTIIKDYMDSSFYDKNDKSFLYVFDKLIKEKDYCKIDINNLAMMNLFIKMDAFYTASMKLLSPTIQGVSLNSQQGGETISAEIQLKIALVSGLVLLTIVCPPAGITIIAIISTAFTYSWYKNNQKNKNAQEFNKKMQNGGSINTVKETLETMSDDQIEHVTNLTSKYLDWEPKELKEKLVNKKYGNIVSRFMKLIFSGKRCFSIGGIKNDINKFNEELIAVQTGGKKHPLRKKKITRN